MGTEVGQINRKTWVKTYVSSAVRTGLEGEMEKAWLWLIANHI